MEAQLQRIQQAFASYPGGQVPKDKFAALAKVRVWKCSQLLFAGADRTLDLWLIRKFG